MVNEKNKKNRIIKVIVKRHCLQTHGCLFNKISMLLHVLHSLNETLNKIQQISLNKINQLISLHQIQP